MIRDHYIGLKRGTDPCSCLESPLHPYDRTYCEGCHLTWEWEDGEQMVYIGGWATEDMLQPEQEDCGRLTIIGWMEQDCNIPLSYICERKVSVNSKYR